MNTRYTLDNTMPLLDEVRGRMGDAWIPPATWADAKPSAKDWYHKEYVPNWESNVGPRFPGDAPVPGKPETFEELFGNDSPESSEGSLLDALSDRRHWQIVRRNIWIAKLDAKNEVKVRSARGAAIASLAQDLRAGVWVGMIRGPVGFSQPFSAGEWQGTDSDEWLRTGMHDSLEIHVSKAQTALKKQTETPAPKKLFFQAQKQDPQFVRRGRAPNEWRDQCISELVGWYRAEGLPTQNTEIVADIDAWFDREGVADENGRPQGTTRFDWASYIRNRLNALNSGSGLVSEMHGK